MPHRATRGEWRRLAFGLLLLAPVVLLVVLPTVLGLERHIVTDRAMHGSVGRGSIVLAREVPPTDLRVGDVITFTRPGDASDRASDGASDDQVVRRIATIEDGVATTRADGARSADPWVVQLAGSDYARVWVGVPWIGYPFLMGGGWVLLALAAVLALALALVLRLTAARRTPPRAARPTPTRQPVG